MLSGCFIELGEVLSVEDMTVLRSSGLGASATELMITDEAIFEEGLERMKLLQPAGGNAELTFQNSAGRVTFEIVDGRNIKSVSTGHILQLPEGTELCKDIRTGRVVLVRGHQGGFSFIETGQNHFEKLKDQLLEHFRDEIRDHIIEEALKSENHSQASVTKIDLGPINLKHQIMIQNNTPYDISWAASSNGTKWVYCSLKIERSFINGNTPFKPIEFDFVTPESLPHYFDDGVYIKYSDDFGDQMVYLRYDTRYVFNMVQGRIACFTDRLVENKPIENQHNASSNDQNNKTEPGKLYIQNPETGQSELLGNKPVILDQKPENNAPHNTNGLVRPSDVKYINIAPVNQWKRVTPLRDYSYKIIDNGHKYWVKDGEFGQVYAGGPGGSSFSLKSSVIYIQSGERWPVQLTFQYTPNK